MAAYYFASPWPMIAVNIQFSQHYSVCWLQQTFSTKGLKGRNGDCVRNAVAHSDAREGKWRGNWWMEWVASTLTRPRNVVYPELLTLMRTPRLPVVNWTDSPTELNGLVHFGKRRNVVSAHVPSGSTRALPGHQGQLVWMCCFISFVLLSSFWRYTLISPVRYDALLGPFNP
jgi:hypothetical protein